MEYQLIFEVIGIAGTLFVLASFLTENQRKTRFINIIGSVLFVVYGLCIGAVSTWLLNGILILIHIYFLLRKGGKRDRGTS